MFSNTNTSGGSLHGYRRGVSWGRALLVLSEAKGSPSSSRSILAACSKIYIPVLTSPISLRRLAPGSKIVVQPSHKIGGVELVCGFRVVGERSVTNLRDILLQCSEDLIEGLLADSGHCCSSSSLSPYPNIFFVSAMAPLRPVTLNLSPAPTVTAGASRTQCSGYSAPLWVPRTQLIPRIRMTPTLRFAVLDKDLVVSNDLVFHNRCSFGGAPAWRLRVAPGVVRRKGKEGHSVVIIAEPSDIDSLSPR